MTQMTGGRRRHRGRKHRGGSATNTATNTLASLLNKATASLSSTAPTASITKGGRRRHRKRGTRRHKRSSKGFMGMKW